MADVYDVTMVLTEPMLGTVPKSKEVYAKFIETRRKEAAEDNETETVPVAVDEEGGWTGFHTDEQGIFVFDYFIKGFLKNSGNIQKEALKIMALKSKINNYLFVSPRRVYIRDAEGTALLKPDDILERPLRADTAQGPRTALVRSDTVNAGRKLTFEIHVVPGHPFKQQEQLLETLLDYGQYQAFGQWRNAGYGRAKVAEFKYRK